MQDPGMEEQHAASPDAEARHYCDVFALLDEGVAVGEMLYDDAGQPVDFRYLEINPAFTRLMGRSMDEIVGRTAREMRPNLDPCWIATYARVVQCGRVERNDHYEARLGKYYEFSAWRIGVGRFAVIFRDVTARKQAEQALMREQAFFAATIDILPLPLVFFNLHGRLISDNAALRAWRKGLDITERSDAQYLDPHSCSVIPESRMPVARALQGEIVKAEEYLVLAPGNTRGVPVLISAAPIYLDGEIVAAVSIIEDITALKTADRAKDEFLAVISHELHTPLTAMLGWSSMALAMPTPELMERALEVVHRNAQRQKILVDELLDTSRLIHRKIELSLEQTDLHTQTCQAVENVQQEAEERHLTLLQSPAADPLPILVDPARLQQCIGNLLQNSLKFTPAGGTITLHCRREGNEAVLSVCDSGRGIDPDMLSSLFTLFRQVDHHARTGGLGLGLAVTRGIAELHGGRVWAHSPGIGQGSTFCIALPLAN